MNSITKKEKKNFFDFKAFAIYFKKEKRKILHLSASKTRVSKDCKGSLHWCDHITSLLFL